MLAGRPLKAHFTGQGSLGRVRLRAGHALAHSTYGDKKMSFELIVLLLIIPALSVVVFECIAAFVRHRKGISE